MTAVQPRGAITALRARQLTDRIKAGLAGIWSLITEAYASGAHLALGYESWDDYVRAEFDAGYLRLPREERGEVVGSMRDAGMTIREIVSATGVSDQTVQKDLRRRSESLQDDEPALTQEQCEQLAEPVEDPGPVVVDPAPRPPAPPPLSPAEQRALNLREGDERAARGIRQFIAGWPYASGTRTSPRRDQILAALGDWDRAKFLDIESEHLR